MSNHTNGPWEAIKKGEGLWHILPIDRHLHRLPIAVLDHSRDGHEPTRTVITPADARVMAASFELLEALKDLRSFMWSEGYADQTAEMAKADAAIAKAEEGKQ